MGAVIDGSGVLLDHEVSGLAPRNPVGDRPVGPTSLAHTTDRLIERWGRASDASFDPYDGLTSARAPAWIRRHRATRLALVHLHRRSPVNLRPLFGVPKSVSAYTEAHFASACVRLAAAGLSETAHAAGQARLAWLRAHQMDGGWAYPFDVQTKTFSYSRSTPNVVCTAFAANAFLDAAELMSDEEALGVVVAAARFAVKRLWNGKGSLPYFRYLPNEPDLIHNGNLLAASFVLRTGTLCRDPHLVEIGGEAAETSLQAIRPDGSIRYGEGPHLRWVDNHHTGFVIEALHRIATDLEGERAASASHAVTRLTQYYQQRLFDDDGRPRARPDRRYPTDAIAGAQGIQTFATVGDHEMARRILGFMLARMRRSSSFVYQRGRAHVKAIPYARWVDAPMALAMATLAVALSDDGAR